MTGKDGVEILGVRIDPLSIAEAWGALPELVEAPRAYYITKPYVEFLDRASEPEIRALLNGSRLCLADGVALQWAAYYLYGGHRSVLRLFSTLADIILRPQKLSAVIPERFAGVDAAWRMLEMCEQESLRIYLVGHPKGGTIEGTANVLAKRLSNLRIVGTFDGYRANSEEEVLTEELRRLRPDIVLVGTGFPRQERMMARLVQRLDHGVFIGEGGTFDYEAFGGKVPRAPRPLRRLGLEWTWRLLLEPRERLGRQMAIPRFIYKIWRSR